MLVTPSGLFLEGPHLETLNRVLRKYDDNMDYFLRVSFVEENGDLIAMHPEPREEIFRGRFKHILDTSLTMSGRAFVFLGKSSHV